MNEQMSDRQSALDEFAAIGAPKQELLPAIIKSAPPMLVHGAQQVAVRRIPGEVMATLKALAAAAGRDWYYSIPFKKKIKDPQTGKDEWVTHYVEGPTIKLANDLWREFGSCEVDTWVSNEGIDYWEVTARFIDLQSGAAMTRLFRQQKGRSKIGGNDPARNVEADFSMGQSKAIRNVITNALQTYADYAVEEARKSLVEKIGRNVQGWRERTAKELEGLGVALGRAEAIVSRPLYEWLAEDIATVVSLIKGINDGMALPDESFPPLKAEPAKATEALDKFAEEKQETPDGTSSGQAAASGPEPTDPATDAATAPDLRQECADKLLNLASDESLPIQDRLELLEEIIPTWEDKVTAEYLQVVAELATQVADGRIRRSSAVKKLEAMK